MEEKARTDGQQTEKNEISYEDLKNAVVQLQQQNQYLQNQIRQNSGIEKRLYFLFEIMKYADLFGDFAKECVDEIKDIMTLPKDEPETKPEEEAK